MAQIKQKRRPAIDYPSGRGTGLPAAGVHTVDRELGALPVDFRLQGASGQPSASADSGYSRATYQRINRGFDADKALESIPEVSWLKQNAEQLSAMGLSPRVVAEMYKALCDHRPQNEREQRILAETHAQVLKTRRRVRRVTEAALNESRVSLVEFIGMDDLASGARSILTRLPQLDIDGDDKPDEDAIKRDVLRDSDRELGGGIVTRSELEDAIASSRDETESVLACNSNALEILQTTLAVTGFVGDLGTFLGIPVGMASDSVNACINIMCKNYFHAMLDVIAIAPFAGDLAKIFYAKRLLRPLGIEAAAANLGTGKVSEQAEAAAKIIEAALEDRTIGPRVSSIILRLKSTYKTGAGLAESLSSFLARVLNRGIDYLEGIKAGAESGSLSMKGASWALSKLPVDLLTVLTRIRDEGLPAFKEFVETLFSRKGAQSTASGAQAREPVIDAVSHQDAPQEEPTFEPAPVRTGGYRGFVSSFEKQPAVRHRSQAQQFLGSQFDPEAEEAEFDDRPADFVFERKSPKKGKLSLISALDGDDSSVDETSTVATSLGAPGELGGGGYVEPLGKRPPGSPRRRLDKLVPGYEFARGRYPYSY